MDLYANGDLDRETYVKKSVELDEELKATGLLKLELSKQIPMIHKEAEIDIAIKQYCKTVKLRYEKCTDFQSYRNLFLDFITKVTHYPESFTLEGKIWNIVETVMVDPDKLKEKISSLQGKKQNVLLQLKRRLVKLDKDVAIINQKKKGVIELYAKGDLDRENYVKKSREQDEDLKRYGLEKLEIIKRIPIIHKEDLIDYSIKQYCENVRLRYEKCADFDSKRRFCLDFIDQLIHKSDGVTLCGSIPILDKMGSGKLEFKIEKGITNVDRRKKRFLLHGY